MRDALVKDATRTVRLTLWEQEAKMPLVEGRTYRARVLIRNSNGVITIGRGDGPGLVVSIKSLYVAYLVMYSTK